MDRDSIYKRHIVDAISSIEDYVRGKTVDDFKNDRLLQDGVYRKLEIIGEASKRLSEDFKTKVDLPWKKIAGTRDKLIHDYFEVDVDAVWETISRDLKELKQKININL